MKLSRVTEELMTVGTFRDELLGQPEQPAQAAQPG